jgi:hypothetical protein
VAVQAVLATFAEFLPITGRQCFYRLVATAGFEKSEVAYKRLCGILNRARRAGLIPWDAIRDDGFKVERGSEWRHADEVTAAVKWQFSPDRFRIDRQLGQERRVAIWCEAGGMVPQLVAAGAEWSVPVYSSGGFDSTTAKHAMAREFSRLRDVVVLHIGDHDPSGVHVFGSLEGDIGSFLEVLGGRAAFVRLAVTPRHIEEFDLETAPPKASDRRVFAGETVQAEALPPDVLAEIVQAAVVERLDPDALADAMEFEERERRRLAAWLDRLPDLDR